MPSDELKKLSIANAPKTAPITETLDQTVARAKAMVAPKPNVQPTVSANDLMNPPAPVVLPQPALPVDPTAKVMSGVTNTLANLKAQSEEQKRLQEEQLAFGALGNETMTSVRDESLKQSNYYANQSEYDDIGKQLALMTGASEGVKQNIASGAGQTLAQGQREIGQEDKEAYIKAYTLNARANFLQGSLETARTMANEAVNLANSDRTFALDKKIKQIEFIQDKVDEEKSAALSDEKRKYEEELATIETIKENVSEALVSGATQAESAQLTGNKLSDQEKIALSQSIIARGAGEMRNLTIADKKANIAQGWANLDLRQQEVDLSRERLNAELNTSGNPYGTSDGKPQNATQALVNGYANRLLEAEGVIASVGNLFTSKTSFGGVLPSILQTPERQQFEQGKRNFINAVLRRESGAVIADNEFTNADKQYFPQPGDSPEVLTQKENNRNTVINNFYNEANVPRPVFAGDVIESNGKKYRVESDGVTITEI